MSLNYIKNFYEGCVSKTELMCAGDVDADYVLLFFVEKSDQVLCIDYMSF